MQLTLTIQNDSSAARVELVLTLKVSIIIGAMVIALLTSNITAAAFASGLGPSDFPEHPEPFCVSNGDDPDYQELCADVNICDEEGEITPDSQFCTGEAVRNLPYPPGGCPEGYHDVESDESGLCYDDLLGCPEGMILKDFENAEGHGCVDYKVNCEVNQNFPLCNGEERNDGLRICDEPDHPAYKFCN
jgi:hypothetical protein